MNILSLILVESVATTSIVSCRRSTLVLSCKKTLEALLHILLQLKLYRFTLQVYPLIKGRGIRNSCLLFLRSFKGVVLSCSKHSFELFLFQ